MIDWTTVAMTVLTIAFTIGTSVFAFFFNGQHSDIKELKKAISVMEGDLKVFVEASKNNVSKIELKEALTIAEKSIAEIDKRYLEITFNITSLFESGERRDESIRNHDKELNALREFAQEIALLKQTIKDIKGKLDDEEK